jgi:hypothetical protein
MAREDTAVFIFALHGMGPNTSQEQFVAPIMERVNRRFLGDGAQPSAAPVRHTSLIPWLRQHLPAGLQNAIAQAVPVSVRDRVVNRSIVDGHDWPRTPGFACLTDLNGYVRLNLRGRESRGMLAPPDSKADKDASRYVEELRKAFLSFRIADSGQPLVEDVRLAADDFPGARSHHLPDLIVAWSGAAPATAIHSETLGTIRAELATGRGGNHRPGGFCVALGSALAHWDSTAMHGRELAALASRVLRVQPEVGTSA